MLLWMATHNVKKNTKEAAPSQPKLKEALKEAGAKDPNLHGTWEVRYVDIGKPNHATVVKLLTRRKYIVKTLETYDAQVAADDDGNIDVKMRKRKDAEK